MFLVLVDLVGVCRSVSVSEVSRLVVETGRLDIEARCAGLEFVSLSSVS